MIRYVSHTPGTGTYELVDNRTEEVIFRGTLKECIREDTKREAKDG